MEEFKYQEKAYFLGDNLFEKETIEKHLKKILGHVHIIMANVKAMQRLAEQKKLTADAALLYADLEWKACLKIGKEVKKIEGIDESIKGFIQDLSKEL